MQYLTFTWNHKFYLFRNVLLSFYLLKITIIMCLFKIIWALNPICNEELIHILAKLISRKVLKNCKKIYLNAFETFWVIQMFHQILLPTKSFLYLTINIWFQKKNWEGGHFFIIINESFGKSSRVLSLDRASSYAWIYRSKT